MVLVKATEQKDKPMTEPSQKPAPDALPTKTKAEASARRSKAFGTFLLAAFLSALLLVGAGAYLTLAPDPVARPNTVPPAAPTTLPAKTMTFVAPRGVIDAELLRDFETETGNSVELILYDNEETLLGAATTSGLNTDVLLASGITIQRLQRNAGFVVLPARLIGNLGRIDPGLRTLSKLYDTAGLYAVPYAWTAIGLGFDRAALTMRLGPTHTIESWATLFDPDVVSKLADCGVYSLDAPSLAFPSVLKSMGLPPFSETPGDIERASAAWEAVRGKISKFDSRALSDGLASGQACLALATASDVYRARAQARDAGQTFSPEFAVPREGSVLRLYMLALPRGAKTDTTPTSRQAALVDYLLKPEVSARMTNTHWLANAVPASQLYVRQDIKGDPGIYPDVAAFARLTPETNPTQAAISLRERFWLLISFGGKAP